MVLQGSWATTTLAKRRLRLARWTASRSVRRDSRSNTRRPTMEKGIICRRRNQFPLYCTAMNGRNVFCFSIGWANQGLVKTGDRPLTAHFHCFFFAWQWFQISSFLIRSSSRDTTPWSILRFMAGPARPVLFFFVCAGTICCTFGEWTPGIKWGPEPNRTRTETQTRAILDTGTKKNNNEK